MYIPHQIGRDEFVRWAGTAVFPKIRCKTFEAAAVAGRPFESEHLSLSAGIALSGIFFEGTRRNLLAPDGYGVAGSIAIRSPKLPDGRPTANENRFMRLIRSTGWDQFYAGMIEALLIVEKTAPTVQITRVPISLGALYDFVRLYDQSMPENNEFPPRPAQGFAHVAYNEFAYHQT